MVSRFEKLPNEVVWSIFEYISPIELFPSFFNLNQRFNIILRSINCQFQLLNTNKNEYDYYIQTIVPNIANEKVESLSIDDILDRVSSINYFENLKVLIIHQLRTSTLETLAEDILPQLKNLTYLRLLSDFTLRERNVNSLTRVILSEQMPSLIFCHLGFQNCSRMTFGHIEENKKTLSLQYLIIDQWCRLRDFIQLLHSVPNIQRLTVRLFDSNLSGGDIASISDLDDFSALVPNLIYLRTKLSHIPFAMAEKLLFLRLPSKLRELSLSTWSIDYANGENWQNLITNKFSNLKHFRLIISLDEIPFNQSVATQNDLDNAVKSFNQSKYFLDHKWNVLLNVNEHDRLKFVIHTVPYPIENFQSTLFNIRRCTTTSNTILSAYRHVKKLNLVLHDETNVQKRNRNESRYLPNVKQFELLSSLSNDSNSFHSLEYFNQLKNMTNLTTIELFDCSEETRLYPIELIDLILKDLPKLTNFIVCHQVFVQLKTKTINTLRNLTLIFDMYSSISPPVTRMWHLLPTNQILTNELISELVKTIPSLFPNIQTLRLIIKIRVSSMSFNSNDISNLENLPNEVYLEIFEYLDVVNIFKTFYFVNKRFRELLTSIKLRIDLLNISKQDFDYYNYFIFPIVSHSIIALRCEDVFDRLIYRISLSKFISLEYLTIKNLYKNTYQHIIRQIYQLSKLIHLNLETSNNVSINEFYFKYPHSSIKTCILNLNEQIFIEGNQCYNNLKCLTINQYHLEDVLSFLHIYTPKLCSLTITLNDDINSNLLLYETETKHCLKTLIIKQCRIPFDRMQRFILSSLPYLKQLQINAAGADYADGTLWENILSAYFPNLNKFQLYTVFPVEFASTGTLRTQLLTAFKTKYFLKHKWYFALIYHPLLSTIDLFSMPLCTTKIHAHLYDTYIEKTVDDVNLFENIVDLTLSLTTSTQYNKLPEFSFRNVKNLRLVSRYRPDDRRPISLFVDISKLIYFSKLQSIEFIGNCFPSTSLVLLDYTTELQSLSIPFNNLNQMTMGLTNPLICQRLTILIKNLTITSIDNLNNLNVILRLPEVFSRLEVLSLKLRNSTDFYILTRLILPKMSTSLKHLTLSIGDHIPTGGIRCEFMPWLIEYLYANDLAMIDMSLEKSFPDEIILEVCRYLTPTDIILSFAGLNQRLNRTISDFIRHVRLYSIISHKNYLYLLRTTLPSIWSSIETLTINNYQTPHLTTFFLKNIHNVLPPNLKRLSLFHLNIDEIYQFINRLMTQTIVEEFTIECKDFEPMKQQDLYGYRIAQMLFYYHPTLKSIKLSGDIIFDLSHLSFLSLSNTDDSNLTSTSQICRLSKLRHLTMSLQSLSSLHLLLIYQPDLEYLNVHIGDHKSTYDYTIKSFPPLLNLKEFHFRSNDLAIKYHNLVELLNYFPNLKSLSLDLTTECPSFFDGDILQTLVGSLDTFQFSIKRSFQPTDIEKTLSTFYTPFWLNVKKWYTECYWYTNENDSEFDYFHIYSIPYPFSNLHIYKYTNEKSMTNEHSQPYFNVKQLELHDTSDINVVPFIKSSPNVHTIYLNNVYDDEEDYGTDEEVEITDENEQYELIEDVQTPNSVQLSLPMLYNVQYIKYHCTSNYDIKFLKFLVNYTPNLHYLNIALDNLVEIIHTPQDKLYQLLKKYLNCLEIYFDYPISSTDIRREIPKILYRLPNVRILTIHLHPIQNRPFSVAKELLLQMFKSPTNLICTNIYDESSQFIVQLPSRQNGIESIQTCLRDTNNVKFTKFQYLQQTFHVELNSSLISVWL